MEMTFSQYIQNPLGKENAVFSNRAMYKDLYTDKLNKLMVREVGKITYNIYSDKENDKYYVYFKIPSETLKDFYYDTVIEFYTDKKDVKLQRDLKNYEVKFYSNDPSFVFTFAYAFNKQKLIVDDFKSKISSKALNTKAVEKNPKAIIGYVKSIYFSYLLMVRYNLFNKVVFETRGSKYNKKDLLKQIMDADEKINLRIEGANSLAKSKKALKNPVSNITRTLTDKSIFTNKVDNISKTSRVKKTSISTSVKLSNKSSKNKLKKMF